MKKFFIIMFLICRIIYTYAEIKDTSQTRVSIFPSIAHIQYAGFIGMISGGFGYQYWHKRINTSFFYGYVPEKYATEEIQTVALKNTIRLVKVGNPRLAYPSIYAGFTVNWEVSQHAFLTLPDYYPPGYYNQQAVHLTFLAGGRLRIPLNETNTVAIEPYGEVGTLDSFLWYYVSRKSTQAWDVLRIAVGLNFYFR